MTNHSRSRTLPVTLCLYLRRSILKYSSSERRVLLRLT